MLSKTGPMQYSRKKSWLLFCTAITGYTLFSSVGTCASASAADTTTTTTTATTHRVAARGTVKGTPRTAHAATAQHQLASKTP